MMGQAKAIAAAVALGAAVALAATWHTGRVKAAEQAVHAHYAIVLADIQGKTAAAQTAFRQREAVWQTKFDKEARRGQDQIDAAQTAEELLAVMPKVAHHARATTKGAHDATTN